MEHEVNGNPMYCTFWRLFVVLLGLCTMLALGIIAAPQRAAQQGAGAELLKLRFLKIILPAKVKFQAVCSAGPQSPQLKR